MNCEDYTPLLSAALDDELTGEERAALDAHLAQCPRCRALLEELRAQDRALEELNAEPPAELKSRVMAAVAAEPRRSPAARGSRSLPWKRWGALAAALVLVVGAAALPRLTGADGLTAGQPNTAQFSVGDPAVRSSGQPAGREGEMGGGSAPDAVIPQEAAPETAGGLSAEPAAESAALTVTGALELVVDRVSADSGYDRTLTMGAESCAITLTDGDTVVDESVVEYLGRSDNGDYYLFRWTWEGQSARDADWYRYAVPLDGSAVIWRGESAPDSAGFDDMLSR